MSAKLDKRVKVAIVGAGRMANAVHYPSLAAMDDVDIIGICDWITNRWSRNRS